MRDYASYSISSGIKSAINVPTRVIFSSATLIDRIYTHCTQHEARSGIAICDLSHHYPVFAVVPATIRKKKANSAMFVKNIKKF